MWYKETKYWQKSAIMIIILSTKWSKSNVTRKLNTNDENMWELLKFYDAFLIRQ